MKNLIILSLLSFCIAACCGGNSIINEPVENENNPEPKEYTVNLGLSGEIIRIDEQPLSRTNTNDLYGVQVYSTPTDGEQRKPYAYGLFDNKEAMTIKLMEGYKYDFVISMIPERENKICLRSWGYSYPFDNTKGGTHLSNSFTYSLDISFIHLNGGYAELSQWENTTFSRPNMDRYHGELNGYIPSENSQVLVEMKRVVFGVKIIAIGLTEGELLTSIENAPQLAIVYPASETTEIISFTNAPGKTDWTHDDYTETAPVSFSWKKSDGNIIPLLTQNITFKRNRQTIITVIVSDNTISNGVDISKENIPMTEGDQITIDTNKGTDTEITPQI